MKKIVFLFGLLLGMQTLVFSQKQNSLKEEPYIEVSASADTLVTPNAIFISINLDEDKSKKSVEEQEVILERTLKNLGIDTRKNLSVADIDSALKKYFWKGKTIVKSKSYELKVGDAVMAGKVYSALENNGISEISLQRMEYEQPEKLLLALKIKALKDAKYSAKKMTAAIGQEIGDAVMINVYQDNYRNRPVYISSFMKTENAVRREDSSENNPINSQFKQIRYEANVNVRFYLKPTSIFGF